MNHLERVQERSYKLLRMREEKETKLGDVDMKSTVFRQPAFMKDAERGEATKFVSAASYASPCEDLPAQAGKSEIPVGAQLLVLEVCPFNREPR